MLFIFAVGDSNSGHMAVWVAVYIQALTAPHTTGEILPCSLQPEAGTEPASRPPQEGHSATEGKRAHSSASKFPREVRILPSPPRYLIGR